MTLNPKISLSRLREREGAHHAVMGRVRALAAKTLTLSSLFLTPIAAHAATIELHISGIPNPQGQVLVALCTRGEFLKPHCALQGRAPAQQGGVIITIPNVPPGDYAAQAFHDANNNQKLDRNFIGIPTEAMGFSNNAPMHYGPPSFDSAAFKVGPENLTLHFALKTYSGF